LLRHKENLLEDERHRIVSSLKVLASILVFKAQMVTPTQIEATAVPQI
jgi:hypothetical protein